MLNDVPCRLKQFLICPDKRRFSDVFDDALVYATGYLLYLRHKGYRLPLDSYSEESATGDLALDVLGSLFQSKPARPFHIIFDYYRSLDLREFEGENPQKLWDLFEKLLKGHIHQELSRLKKHLNPQAEILKRRFKDIMKEDAYAGVVHGYTEFVHLKATQPDFTLPVIPYEQLCVLVEEAFAGSTSRAGWCRTVLELLAAKSGYCGAVSRTDLLRVVVSVNAAFLEIPEFAPRSLPDAREGAIRNAISEIRRESLASVAQNVIAPFVQKKRIPAHDAERYLAACERYLDDFGHDGDTDAIPGYFREVMPEEYFDSYLKEFKYVFETVLQRAREDFASRLKNSPTVRQFGDYWNTVD